MSLISKINSLAQAVGAEIKTLVSGKANVAHTHTVDDIPGLGPILDAATRTYWADILGKPSVFPAAPPAEVDLGTVSGTVTLSAAAPYKRRYVVSGNATFTPATPPPGEAPTLRLHVTGTPAFAGVTWLGGEEPAWGAVNIVVLDYAAGGWIGDGGAV